MQSSFEYQLLQPSQGIINANNPGAIQAQRVHGFLKQQSSFHTPVPRFSMPSPSQHDLWSLNLSPLQLEPSKIFPFILCIKCCSLEWSPCLSDTHCLVINYILLTGCFLQQAVGSMEGQNMLACPY